MRHLDIGCGDDFAIRSIEPEEEAIEVDIREGMLSYARQRGIEASTEDLS